MVIDECGSVDSDDRQSFEDILKNSGYIISFFIADAVNASVRSSEPE
jgi:hypothetical protein